MAKRKEFKDADSNGLYVAEGAVHGTVYIGLTDGRNRDTLGGWFPNDRAAEIALAVLEAAGYVAEDCVKHEEYAVFCLKLAVERNEREAEEAKEAALKERRDEWAKKLGASPLGYEDTFDSTRRGIDEIIRLEDAAA